MQLKQAIEWDIGTDIRQFCSICSCGVGTSVRFLDFHFRKIFRLNITGGVPPLPEALLQLRASLSEPHLKYKSYHISISALASIPGNRSNYWTIERCALGVLRLFLQKPTEPVILMTPGCTLCNCRLLQFACGYCPEITLRL